MKRVMLGGLAATLLSGCVLMQQPACPPDPAAASTANAAPGGQETEAQRRERLMWELSTRSIYFESGNFAVKSEYQDLLRQVQAFLKATPGVSIALIGNADERGRGQVADGQRRADAVRQVLKSLGVEEARMEAISLGDKNPQATCHAERCWAQNRRVDIVFMGADGRKR